MCSKIGAGGQNLVEVHEPSPHSATAMTPDIRVVVNEVVLGGENPGNSLLIPAIIIGIRGGRADSGPGASKVTVNSLNGVVDGVPLGRS